MKENVIIGKLIPVGTGFETRRRALDSTSAGLRVPSLEDIEADEDMLELLGSDEGLDVEFLDDLDEDSDDGDADLAEAA